MWVVRVLPADATSICRFDGFFFKPTIEPVLAMAKVVRVSATCASVPAPARLVTNVTGCSPDAIGRSVDCH